MPWKPEDAQKHKQGLTAAQSKRWSATANAVLESCMTDGGDSKECEGKAIRIANAKCVDEKHEATTGVEVIYEASFPSFKTHPKVTIDREKGVIHGAMVFGPTDKVGDYFESANGFLYAGSFFESLAERINTGSGAPGWDGHPDKDMDGTRKTRRIKDSISKTRTAAVVWEDSMPKVRGDYHLLASKRTEYMDAICENADIFGLSVGMKPKTRFDAILGRQIFESIDKDFPFCVDLVDYPSATRNFFEAVEPSANKENNMETDTQVAEAKKQLGEVNEGLIKAKADLAKITRENLVTRKIQDAKLGDDLVTEALQTALTTCEESKMDGIITDYKTKISAKINPVTGMGAAADAAATHEDKKFADAIFETRERGLGVVFEALKDGKQGSEGSKRAVTRWNAEIKPLLWDTRRAHDKQGDFKWDNPERLAILEGFLNTGLKAFYRVVTGREPYEGMRFESAIESSTYTEITTSLLSSRMIEGYNVVEGLVGDQFVTAYPSKLLAEKFPGFDAAAGIAEVDEGDKYPDATIAEKAAGDVTWKKRGVMVQITEETIMYDQTGMILMRANQIGNSLRVDREKKIIGGIEDTLTEGVYFPSSASFVKTALYGVLNTKTANPLGEIGAFDAADKMLSEQVDSNSEYVAVTGTTYVVLVPSALWRMAQKLTKLLEYRHTTTDGNMLVGGNPYSDVQPIKANYLTSATTWYYGTLQGFRQQFILKSHMPFRVIQVNPAEVSGTTKDIVGGVVARWKEHVFALDTKHVIKNTAT